MKLLLLTQYFPPETGASATRNASMARFLKKEGWDIEVVCEQPNYPMGELLPGYQNRFHQTEEFEGIPVQRLWVWLTRKKDTTSQLLFFLSFMFSSAWYLLRNPKRYDIVYVSSPPMFPALSGWLAARLFGSKLVLEIRDIWPDAAVDIGKFEEKSWLFYWGEKLERWLYRQVDLIVPVTDHSERIIQQRCGSTPTKVVYNGIDPDHFINHKKSRSASGFTVGYVGSLGVIHDLETLVRAAKYCESDPEIQFVVVGDGGKREEFKRLLETYQPTNLCWEGLIPHDQVPRKIATFDIALNPVFPSRSFESIITVKFYEYLASSTPVISTAKGLMEVVGNRSKACITVKPQDPKAIQEQIMYLKNNPDLLDQMGRDGREFVIRNFSRKKMASLLSGTLKQLIR